MLIKTGFRACFLFKFVSNRTMSISEKYHLLSPLGNQHRRKFGQVFLVEEKTSHQQFVLKALKKTGTKEFILDQVRNEANFNFSFPGLPKVIEFSETAEELLLILEYQQGKTLDIYWGKIKKRERISELKKIVNALLPIFNYLKENQIVHADIKPSNILIEDINGELKVSLIDFGLALNVAQANTHRKILFPLGYAAPELILNRLVCVNHTTDLFALGIVFWKLFAGKLPLTHPNPSIFTNLQITYPIPENEEIPKELMRILQRMCYKTQFSTAPNLMPQEKVDLQLTDATTKRYQSIDEIKIEFDQLSDRKNWINRVLFGNQGQK